MIDNNSYTKIYGLTFYVIPDEDLARRLQFEEDQTMATHLANGSLTGILAGAPTVGEEPCLQEIMDEEMALECSRKKFVSIWECA